MFDNGGESEELDDLGELASLEAVVGRLSAGRLDADTATVRRLVDAIGVLHATLCEVETRLDEHESWRDDGASSLRAWLVHECGLSRRDASAHVRRVDRLRSWPQVLYAWRSGRVSQAQVDVLVGGVPPRFVSRFAADADLVLDVVAPLDLRTTELAVRQWVRCAESEDGPESYHERASGVYVATLLDESLSISGVLHGADAAVVEAALRVFDIPDPTDDDGSPSGPPRTLAGRTADALVAMARCALDHRDGPGEHGRFHPHVVVTVDVAQLRASALRGAGVRTVAGVERRARERGWSAVETAWFVDALRHHGDGVTSEGLVLDAGALSFLSCDSVVQRMLTNGSRVLDLGRETRTATPSQRRAVVARDRHCRAPGCRTGPRFCQVHHIDHWIDGGRTDVSRMVLLCGTHHREFHRPGHRMELDEQARFTVVSPRGWSRSTEPEHDERTVFAMVPG